MRSACHLGRWGSPSASSLAQSLRKHGKSHLTELRWQMFKQILEPADASLGSESLSRWTPTLQFPGCGLCILLLQQPLPPEPRCIQRAHATQPFPLQFKLLQGPWGRVLNNPRLTLNLWSLQSRSPLQGSCSSPLCRAAH